jgi:hypothetical protein
VNPLLNSFTNGDLEADLQALFIQLYNDTLTTVDDEVNVYGAPHLGSLALIQRNLAQDGISVLNNVSEDGLRYLFRAWRYQNPQRGTHFLETYLRVLFGDVFEINQLYQKKDVPYPDHLVTMGDILASGGSESDYFLTSRLRVDLTTSEVPERVISALRTVVAARMVLEVRIAQSARSDFETACSVGMLNFFTASGVSSGPPEGAPPGNWQYDDVVVSKGGYVVSSGVQVQSTQA